MLLLLLFVQLSIVPCPLSFSIVVVIVERRSMVAFFMFPHKCAPFLHLLFFLFFFEEGDVACWILPCLFSFFFLPFLLLSFLFSFLILFPNILTLSYSQLFYSYTPNTSNHTLKQLYYYFTKPYHVRIHLPRD